MRLGDNFKLPDADKTDFTFIILAYQRSDESPSHPYHTVAACMETAVLTQVQEEIVKRSPIAPEDPTKRDQDFVAFIRLINLQLTSGFQAQYGQNLQFRFLCHYFYNGPNQGCYSALENWPMSCEQFLESVNATVAKEGSLNLIMFAEDLELPEGKLN